MAFRLRTGKRNLVVAYRSEDGEIDYLICDDDLGIVMDESDIDPSIDKEKIIQVSFPEQVECIEYETFKGFINLSDVEIRGDVYGVEWQGGTDDCWTVPLSPAIMAEELKRGTGRIVIFRKPKC